MNRAKDRRQETGVRSQEAEVECVQRLAWSVQRRAVGETVRNPDISTYAPTHLRTNPFVACFLLLASCFWLLSSCGLFSDGSTNSEGTIEILGEQNQSGGGGGGGEGEGDDEDVGETPPTPSESVAASINFNAEEGASVFKAIPITNGLSDLIVVNGLSFENNVCGDFFLYDVINAAGAILYDGDGPIQFAIPVGGTFKVRIGYSPTTCSTSDYQAILSLVYTAGNRTSRITVALVPSSGPGGGGGGGGGCGDDPRQLEYQTVEDVSGRLPASVEGIQSYLRVDRLRGVIIPGTLPPVPTGTDVRDDFPHPYESAFLPIEVDAEGHVIISQIDDCLKFILPSGDGDPYFMGADIGVTTFGDISGTSLDDGLVEAAGLEAYLFAEGINVQSPIQKDGQFGIAVRADLTTGTTSETSPELASALARVRTMTVNGEPLIDVVDATGANGQAILALKGGNLINGKMILVGIGRFTDRNFVGNQDTAGSFLINRPNAFIFLRLDVTLAKRAEEAVDE